METTDARAYVDGLNAAPCHGENIFRFPILFVRFLWYHVRTIQAKTEISHAEFILRARLGRRNNEFATKRINVSRRLQDGGGA